MTLTFERNLDTISKSTRDSRCYHVKYRRQRSVLKLLGYPNTHTYTSDSDRLRYLATKSVENGIEMPRRLCNTSCASVPVHSPAARRCGGFAAVGSAVSSSRTAARRTAANAGSVTLPATGRGCVDRLVCVKTLQTISSAARLGPM